MTVMKKSMIPTATPACSCKSNKMREGRNVTLTEKECVSLCVIPATVVVLNPLVVTSFIIMFEDETKIDNNSYLYYSVQFLLEYIQSYLGLNKHLKLTSRTITIIQSESILTITPQTTDPT